MTVKADGGTYKVSIDGNDLTIYYISDGDSPWDEEITYSLHAWDQLVQAIEVLRRGDR